MSANKVRDAANLVGVGKPKAKPKAKGKGVKVSEKLKEAWNDMYASDQSLTFTPLPLAFGLAFGLPFPIRLAASLTFFADIGIHFGFTLGVASHST